jgi:predicted enzyme related to lactoylglutathione lyase
VEGLARPQTPALEALLDPADVQVVQRRSLPWRCPAPGRLAWPRLHPQRHLPMVGDRFPQRGLGWTGTHTREIGMNFNNILIGSANPEILVEYYTKLFGKPGFEEGGYAGWQIGSGFVSIGPHSEVSGKSAQPGRLIWNIETADVAGEFAKMQAAGAIVVREPYEFEGAPGSAIATLADPDGNYFQLTTPYEDMTAG